MNGVERTEQAHAYLALFSSSYEALTDEGFNLNFELYGTIGGEVPKCVGIGLPSILIRNKYKTVVLLGYVIFVVAVVKCSAALRVANSMMEGRESLMRAFAEY